ncbi:MAG: hypothetical protein DMF79_19885 [Acidobacteria bacterium]|nr:MAG: hypothetical protein DMF79_19885 [Acidobacteriota bacterium]
MASSDEPPGAADWLILVAPGIIWGASFLFIAEGLRVIGPCGVTFVRILVGFATLAAVALILGVMVRGERVALLSVLGGAVCAAGAWLTQRAQMGD